MKFGLVIAVVFAVIAELVFSFMMIGASWLSKESMPFLSNGIMWVWFLGLGVPAYVAFDYSKRHYLLDSKSKESV